MAGNRGQKGESGEGRMKTVQRRKDKDGLLREAGPLWIGFVFALYRATMSRQWRDNAGITTATRRRTENGLSLSLSLFLSFSVLFSSVVQFSSSGTCRKDARRKNERNNGFIISGLYRRAGCHCSASFLAAVLAARRAEASPTVELR